MKYYIVLPMRSRERGKFIVMEFYPECLQIPIVEKFYRL